jgi:membrane AbrB-like protein
VQINRRQPMVWQRTFRYRFDGMIATGERISNQTGLASRARFGQTALPKSAMAFLSSRFLEFLRSHAGAQWACLVVFSLVFAAALKELHLSAALLLGPMIAGMIVASAGGTIRVGDPVFAATQSVIGCMIARAIPVAIVHEAAMQWPVFLLGVTSTVAMAALVGWMLARWRVLPGTSAIWGSSPGGAAAMTVMSEAYGADIRLVAFMQYLRVLCVTSVASLVASTAGREHPAVATIWFPAVDWFSFAETLAVASLGLISAKVLRVRAGAVLLPLIVGGILSNAGAMHIELPPWLLAGSYALLGWAIGLRFTKQSIAYAARALPRVLAAILSLIAACAGVGQILAKAAGVDALTAYLATSPGGLDATAIIATDSDVDVPFVLSMQFARILVVLAIGPWLARFLAGRAAEQSGAA